jgi:MFS transporter, DHA1 family, chloramphenicol resistance protein
VFALANAAPTNFSAFNVGITAGPWLGGLAIGAGAGYPSVAWIGAALGALALGTVALGTVALGTVALAAALHTPRPGSVAAAGTGDGSQEPALCQ